MIDFLTDHLWLTILIILLVIFFSFGLHHYLYYLTHRKKVLAEYQANKQRMKQENPYTFIWEDKEERKMQRHGFYFDTEDQKFYRDQTDYLISFLTALIYLFVIAFAMEFAGNLEINTTLAGIIGLAIICVPVVLLGKLQMDNQQQQQRIKKLEEELRQAKKYINNLEQFQQKTIKDTMQAAIMCSNQEENNIH